LEGGGVNTGKTLKFEKVGVHDPPYPIVASPVPVGGGRGRGGGGVKLL